MVDVSENNNNEHKIEKQYLKEMKKSFKMSVSKIHCDRLHKF